MNDLTAACCAFTAPFEGNILWPYLDGPGNPTVGVGHLLYSALYAQTLFPGIAVHDFAEQWADLKAAAPNRNADFYETTTELRITPEQSAALFASDMDRRHTIHIKRELPTTIRCTAGKLWGATSEPEWGILMYQLPGTCDWDGVK